MTVRLFENPSSVNDRELGEDLLLLPNWRREKVLSYRFLLDRVLCAKAYLLLKQGLKEDFGVSGNPAFDYLEYGKPVLRDYPDIHFNLSHCKKGVLCVIGDEPVGCDIETIEESLDASLCRACHSDREISNILSSVDPCVEFTRLWTMKESCLKLTGEGVNDSLPSLFDGDELAALTFDTVVRKDKGFIYTICRHSRNYAPRI